MDKNACKIEKENTRPVDLQSNMYTQANCHYKLVVYVGWFIMPFPAPSLTHWYVVSAITVGTTGDVQKEVPEP